MARLSPLLLIALALAGCGASASGDGAASVVATTTQAANLTRAVAGERAQVVGLLAPTADPHDYEPRPRDVKALAGADLVVRSGGEVDAWLAGAIEASGADANVAVLIDAARPAGGDPHWWQDPVAARRALPALRDALTRADPAGRGVYAANAAAYSRRLGELDRAVAACVRTIPLGRRRLVTTHDALGPYARRYGLEVLGTVIPSRSTRGQASARDTARLVATIRRARVPAIFAESSVNASVERAIAREAGARVGGELWADTLGPKGSEGASYIGSIAANTRTIAAGLGGDRDCVLPR